MSIKKHVHFQSSTLKETENLYINEYKKSLNNLWKHFMSSFGYKKYYNISKKTDNISYDVINNNTCDLSIKLFSDFLQENSITIINHNLIANDKTGFDILSEAKIWIMSIVYNNYINNNNKAGLNNEIVMNIFKEAIKNGCDVISLFEFFLIYISDINEKYFSNDFNIKNIREIIPKEFIEIYFKKKNILRNIFQKNEYEDNFLVNMRNSLKNILISDEKDKNIKINLDIKDIIIISKDYLNKGYFVIFKDKKDSFIANYNLENDVDEDDNYCLMPLLVKYKNYEQKLDANKTLNLINKSIYKNYTYYPHNINIINKL